MQDLMELKGMHTSNPVCACNLPSLECFKDSAIPPSWSAGKVWTDLGVLSLLLVFLYKKKIADKFPFQVVWGLCNGSFVQHLVNFLRY